MPAPCVSKGIRLLAAAEDFFPLLATALIFGRNGSLSTESLPSRQEEGKNKTCDDG